MFSLHIAQFTSDSVKCAGEESITGVQKCKNVAGRQSEALVQGVCRPGVRFSNQHEMIVSVENRTSVIGGHPVNNYVFHIWIVLDENAFNSLLYEAILIE